MTTAYLIPCTCGEKLRIDASQAGLDVRCTCGRDVKAPTLRGLSQLERVEVAPTKAPPMEWGALHRLLLGGSLIAVCGLAIAAWFWMKTPPYDPEMKVDPELMAEITTRIKALPAETIIEEWQKLATEGLDRSEPANLTYHHAYVVRMHGFMYTGMVLAVIGGLIMATALLVGGKATKKPARQAPAQ